MQSVHVPHLLQQQEGEWLISVSEQHHAEAIGHLVSFERENRNWPPVKEEPVGLFSFKNRQSPTVLVMGCLLIFYFITGSWQDGSVWFQAGAVNFAQIVDNGQWWRLVTGLTLHADPVHVLGNVVIGGIVIHFLCKILGGGLGWMLVVLAGVAGNSANIFLRGEQHLSVGFSTAVFGAVGVLTGLELKRQRTFKSLVLPLGAGVGLLAMLGSSGERTDLGAHLWGLVTGGGIGFIIACLPNFLKWCNRWKPQLLFFVLAVVVVVGSWYLALL